MQRSTRQHHPYGFFWRSDEALLRPAAFDRFIPSLTAMGASWLVIRAPLRPLEGAESIGRALRAAAITPLLHLTLPDESFTPDEIRSAIEGWRAGGVELIAFDDQPNSVLRWQRWEPHDLPQRYARWLAPALATLAESPGVTPLFPPLAPGGDYWDSSFLREALEELKRLAPPGLDRLAVGCYNHLAGRPVSWGAGGPGRWGTSQRGNLPGKEDQIGFRGWEWAQATASQALGRPVTAYTLGTHLSPGLSPTARAAEVRALRTALGTLGSPPPLAAAFCLLAEGEGIERAEGWYRADGSPVQPEAIEALRAAPPAPSPAARLPATVRLLLPGGQVRAMALDEYLRGVLPPEMGTSAPMEALKAQAVAARCYAARAVMAPRHAGEGADLCATTHCQVWKPAHATRTDEAVAQTSGTVALYGGQIINAYYFACCDGNTRNSEDVWVSKVPYCRSVPCTLKGETKRGHGVGLCQRGAIRMAEEGASAGDILRHYYRGVTVERLEATGRATAGATAGKRVVERRRGPRAVAGTLPQAGQPITVLDPWGYRYGTTSGSRPDLGPNGWLVRVPVDGLYRVEWPEGRLEVAINDEIVLFRLDD